MTDCRPRFTLLEMLVVAARRACAMLTDRLGTLYLERADDCLCQNQPEQAVLYLQRIFVLCPGSSQAQTARLRLVKLQPLLAGHGASTKQVRAIAAKCAG